MPLLPSSHHPFTRHPISPTWTVAVIRRLNVSFARQALGFVKSTIPFYDNLTVPKNEYVRSYLIDMMFQSRVMRYAKMTPHIRALECHRSEP
jgi:hypothetical protein